LREEEYRRGREGEKKGGAESKRERGNLKSRGVHDYPRRGGKLADPERLRIGELRQSTGRKPWDKKKMRILEN